MQNAAGRGIKRGAPEPAGAGGYAGCPFESAGLGIYNISPIQIAAIQTENEHFRGRRVGCDRNVMHVAQAREHMDVGLVLAVGHGITEEQDEVDLVVRDAGRNLLLTALHTREISFNFETGCL